MLVIFQQTLDAGRIGIAAQGLGIAQVCKCIKQLLYCLKGCSILKAYRKILLSFMWCYILLTLPLTYFDNHTMDDIVCP